MRRARRYLGVAIVLIGVVALLSASGAFTHATHRATRHDAHSSSPTIGGGGVLGGTPTLPTGSTSKKGTGATTTRPPTGTGRNGSGSTGSSAATSAPNAPVVGNEIKPIIRGLIDRQGPPAKKDLSAVHAYVVKVNWADLQPTPFGPIAADNAIDQAIARVRQPDYRALGMALKLRVFAGIGAPQWAKTLDGPAVPYVDNQPGGSVDTGTIPRFWLPDFGRAYADLQQKLAAKYDLVPEIREITVSRCSTIFDEPFVRQFGDKANVAAMQAAGYTMAADQQCIVDSIAEHSAWRHTTSDVDFSPFPHIDDPGNNHDVAFPESVMALCRAELGRRCGLQNNSLSSDKLDDATFAQLYQRMRQLGPAITLQTATGGRIGDPAGVLDAAVNIGANAVELPNGYPGWSLSLLQSVGQELAANPTG